MERWEGKWQENCWRVGSGEGGGKKWTGIEIHFLLTRNFKDPTFWKIRVSLCSRQPSVHFTISSRQPAAKHHVLQISPAVTLQNIVAVTAKGRVHVWKIQQSVSFSRKMKYKAISDCLLGGCKHRAHCAPICSHMHHGLICQIKKETFRLNKGASAKCLLRKTKQHDNSKNPNRCVSVSTMHAGIRCQVVSAGCPLVWATQSWMHGLLNSNWPP